MKRAISLLAAAVLLLAAPVTLAGEHPCDFDGSGAFDQADKDAILAAQGEVVVPGSTFDLDGDGVVSLVDVSICIEQSQ